MRKAKATYNAPEGDNKVVEMGGVTFFNGQPVELNTDDNGALIDNLSSNHHFTVELGAEEEAPKRGPGRPKKEVKPLTNVEQIKAQQAAEEADKAAALKAAEEKDKAEC